MLSAKFCNSRPASAAVVASFDSVLYCTAVLTVYCTAVYICLILRLIEWTGSRLCYKTRATAIVTHQAAKLCHIDVQWILSTRPPVQILTKQKSVKRVAGGAIPTV